MNVVYAPRALRDLKFISLYLLERNPAGAANVLGAIKSSIETLGFFPQIGRRINKGSSEVFLEHSAAIFGMTRMLDTTHHSM